MKRVLGVVVVVVALGALFAFGLRRGPPDRDIQSVRIDKPVPTFELPVNATLVTRYGPEFRLEDHLGKPVVVNFWASWCDPCRAEAPVLEAAWKRYGDEVTILGVQTQDPGSAARGIAFVNEFGLTFPNVFDDDSRVSVDYGLFGVPETFFVRADGTLAYKHTGPLTPQVIDTHIEELLR